MKWLDSLEKWLDPLEKRLDSVAVGEADLSRRGILTSLALNLVALIPLFAVGYALRLTLGPTGVAVASLVGFAVAYGTAVILVYRYIERRRRAPSEP